MDQEFVDEMISLNVGGRVFDFLKEHVQMNMKPVENSHAAFNEDEKIYEIRQLALAKNDSQAVFDTIELLSMLLSNVTVSEEGQKHLIGDLKKRGVVLDNLFGMFCYFLKSAIFDFLANVIANVTAVKEGRDIVVKADWLPKILDMIRWDKVSQHRRKHLIECVRNVAFGYEDYEAKFTELSLVKELGHILADEEGLTADLLPE